MRFSAFSLFVLVCCAAQPASSLSAAESWPWSRKKVERAPVQKVESVAKPEEDILGELTKPGCYMRMASGCPKKPMRTELWRHDSWAERDGVNATGCKLRKQVWDKYCDSSDAQMAFVADQVRTQ
ncbi:unnamed protein product [Prorocentrum cordatum]|uniref:Uncharacterized protein n=1 Tax=Prorocentrum cordatum TaxID=2364126 RepID=A0ABN9WS34_9DINO|nr:unnamed protein product [Polarella glacialis]